MPRSHPGYPLEFMRQTVDLAGADRSPGGLARELKATPQSIRNRLKPAHLTRGVAERADHGGELGAGSAAAGEQAVSPRVRDPGKSRGLARTGDRLDPRRIFELVKANRAGYPTGTMCRTSGASSSGYWAWRKGPSCERFRVNTTVAQPIGWNHLHSPGT